MSARVSLVAVVCPDCDAQVGQKCTPSHPHTSRRRMAVRFHLEQTIAQATAAAEVEADTVVVRLEAGLLPANHGVCPRCGVVTHLVRVNKSSSAWIPGQIGDVLIGSHSPGMPGTRRCNPVKCPGTYQRRMFDQPQAG